MCRIEEHLPLQAVVIGIALGQIQILVVLCLGEGDLVIRAFVGPFASSLICGELPVDVSDLRMTRCPGIGALCVRRHGEVWTRCVWYEELLTWLMC